MKKRLWTAELSAALLIYIVFFSGMVVKRRTDAQK